MKVKLLKNIKYNKKYHRVGETIIIAADDIDEFVEKEVINADEVELVEDKKEDEETDITGQATAGEKKDTDIIAFDEITKEGIGELLSVKGIEYNARSSKQELYDLLLGSD